MGLFASMALGLALGARLPPNDDRPWHAKGRRGSLVYRVEKPLPGAETDVCVCWKGGERNLFPYPHSIAFHGSDNDLSGFCQVYHCDDQGDHFPET